MEKIGLFAIKNVIFPESALPLHVFEKKYISLMNKSLEEGKPIGVNLKNDGKIYDYGCSARILDEVKRFDDGRMNVLLQGIQRYVVKDLTKNENAYKIASVDFVNDDESSYDETALAKCVDKFNELVASIKSLDIKRINANKIQSSKPSFYIAQKCGLSLNQKYKLLKILNENKRLDFLYDHLTNIAPVIKEAAFVSRLTRNDGYYDLDISRDA